MGPAGHSHPHGDTARMTALDDPNAIARLDPHGARDVLGRFPAQCREALALRPVPEVRVSPPRLVVIAGVGGSAVGGDLLAACLGDRLTVPVLTHRGYGLPAMTDAATLVVTVSYSGDTAEAVSACEAALKTGAATLVLTTGGRLGALAALRGVPAVTLLPTVPPEEVAEALEIVEAVGAALGPAQQTPHNEAKRLALAVGDRMPIIYGGQITACPAYRWKTDVEENAKRFAVAGALPEMNHNELEAWRAPEAGRLQAIFLRDPGEHPDIDRRFAILRAMIEPAAGGVSEVWSRGEGRLARLLSLISLGQWTSYYLALLHGVDPWVVPMLDEVKRRLRP
ncbi:MAG: bifunctional phosphoglucose/phosphomannose isomerase [Candidatus Rokuibacteriota bacterium]|nr:MAG: bifunctional phosphoglucose/phosphomannose isomerase [Candidatus Rokubacteria bacterium]